MLSNNMYSPCAPNGPWFRFTDDGSIEVENSGISSRNSLPSRISLWEDLINQNAAKWQIAPSIICAFMCQESQGNEKAVSPSNAYGLMQIIPLTGSNWGKKYLNRTITTNDLLDSATNIALGSAGLADLMKQYNNNIVRVAASYNSGDNRCGQYCFTNKQSGEKTCCPANKWNLKTNCGYIDGIILYNNTAIKNGYSGNLILVSPSFGWRGLAFLASMVVGGAVVVFGAKKGLF